VEFPHFKSNKMCQFIPENVVWVCGGAAIKFQRDRNQKKKKY
jgi:hypothetical protein